MKKIYGKYYLEKIGYGTSVITQIANNNKIEYNFYKQYTKQITKEVRYK